MATPQERRLQAETRQLNRKKAELAKEQEKMRTAKVEIERDRRALETEKREWKNKKAKFAAQMQRNRADSSTPASPRRRVRPGGGDPEDRGKIQKLQALLERFKRENTEVKADLRASRRDCKNLQRDNRVLSKQLAGKNRAATSKNASDDYLVNLSRAQVKRMKIDLKIATKKIMKLLKSVRVRKRYYGRQINTFKRSERQWQRDREERFENERIVVKHHFTDQIRKIKLSRGNNRVTLVTDDGEVVITPDKIVLAQDNGGDDIENVEDILGDIDLDDVEIDEEDMEDSEDDEDEDTMLDDDDLENEMIEDGDDEKDLEDDADATEMAGQESSEGYVVGDDVVVKSGGGDHGGVLRYIGETEKSEGETVYGIELTDGSLGTGSGMSGETQYFECPDMRGIFVKEIRRKMRAKDRELFAAQKAARERNEVLRRSSSLNRRSLAATAAREAPRPEDFDKLAELMNQTDRDTQREGFEEIVTEYRNRQRRPSSASSTDGGDGTVDEDGVNVKFVTFVQLLDEVMAAKANDSLMSERQTECFLAEVMGRFEDANRLRIIFVDESTDVETKRQKIDELVEEIATRHGQVQEENGLPDDLKTNNDNWRESIGQWSAAAEAVAAKTPAGPSTPKATSAASTPSSSRRGSKARKASSAAKKRRRRKKVAWHVSTMITSRSQMFSDADLEEV